MLSRRQFLKSTAAVAATAALSPVAKATPAFIGVDAASGPDTTVIFLQTPSGPDHSWILEHFRQEVRRLTRIDQLHLGQEPDDG